MQSIGDLIYKLIFDLKLIALFALSAALFSPVSTAEDQKNILVLGDSLSAAYNMASEQGWVALLQARIRELSESQDDIELMNVINASVSGATTAAGLQILPSALTQHQPDIVILGLGANDGLQGKPLNYIRRNLERLIQLCKNSHVKVILLGQRIPPNYGDAYALPFYEQFADLAQSHELAYVPFLLDGVAGHDQLMMSDGLHPKPEAQRRVLDNVWPALRPLLQKDQ